MKKPKIQINVKPLFAYNPLKNRQFISETDPPTDPTTTVITLTKTGIFAAGR
jgi:hypothetical protein